MSVGSLSPTALIFRAPHRSGDPVVDARSFLCRNGHGLRPPSGRCRCERASPSNSPSPACFSCLCPETGHRLFLLRPSSHRRAVSEVLFAAALFRYGRLPRPAARSACMPAPSCGPSGHNHCIPLRPRLPCPVSRPVRRQGTPQARCPKNGACHKQPDKRVWEGWSWPDAGPQDRSHQERRYSEKKGQGVQQVLSPACPPARKRHEFL